MNLGRTLPRLPALPLKHALMVAVVLLLAAAAARVLTPQLSEVRDIVELESALPSRFGPWRELPSPLIQVNVALDREASLDQPYDQVVMRAYQRDDGAVVYLAVAWGRRQRQEVKVHRPDLCYTAQGYRVASLASQRFDDIDSPDGAVPGKRMLALGRRGGEAVSYWMRIGELFSEDAWETRLHILRQGLDGRIPDGVLVRASMRVRDAREAEQAWPVTEAFLADLTSALSPPARRMLLGWGRP
ncbi:MAG: EpsI family protein [Rhodocyclaceae bacterium]|nr:EpsI family protein [Rhodocyclaceae bacterium]